MAVVGPSGVSGPSGLADLVSPGEGSAGGGSWLGEQGRSLFKCRITAIIRCLIRTCNRRLQRRMVVPGPVDPADPRQYHPVDLNRFNLRGTE